MIFYHLRPCWLIIMMLFCKFGFLLRVRTTFWMRLMYRCLLKTHPNQSKVLAEAVSTSSSTIEGDHTKQHSVSTLYSHTSSHNGCHSMCVDDSSVWGFDWSSIHTPRISWTLGLPFATGTIQFERFANQKGESELTEELKTKAETVAHSPPTVRVKVVLPPWLSYKALDMITWKSQIGWKQCLRVNNVFPSLKLIGRQPTPLDWARNTMYFGSLDQLRTQFGNREITPWDETSDGTTLLTVSAV